MSTQSKIIRFLQSIIFLGLGASVTATTASATSGTISNAFLIKLSSDVQLDGAVDYLQAFHQQATALNYTVRHEFRNPSLFSGLSIQVTGNITEEDALAQLQSIPGVISVSEVYNVGLPLFTEVSAAEPFLSDPNPPALKSVSQGTGNLNGALQMGGVDKLHALGIKGKGIKIGVIDTGVDHRHPALGAGFGPGYKIAGGYSFVLDDGTLQDGPDPLATCYGGGHGTHVSGILGMDPVAGSFDITGVAPEASIYMYRVFDCSGNAGSDTIGAALSKALADKVDVVSMSIGIGAESFSGATDPLGSMVKQVTDAGIAVVVAIANDGTGSEYDNQLYSAEWPGTEPTAIGVGAIANLDFPLVYAAEDSAGAAIQYGSVYPLDVDYLDVLLIDNGCDSSTWTTALASISNMSQTIIGFPVSSFCKYTDIGWAGSSLNPVYLLGYNANTTDPYDSAYSVPSRGFFANISYISLNAADGSTLLANFASSGGYGKYKLYLGNGTFSSPQQVAGGLMDYYSSFGPTWHDYLLKPQISAPGGDILSTWPLGTYGAYTILSGTSMATPYLAGSYALLKSQFLTASIDELQARLQTTAKPVSWVRDKSILSATAQQGAGLVNVYDAVFCSSVVYPGQVKISDVSPTVYGAANFSIKNTSPQTKTYTFSHQGAGYMDYRLSYMEIDQQAKYGSANFSSSQVTLASGESTTVPFSISPPGSVDATTLPVFGGFITVTDSESETYSIPYIGPPYSLFNTDYLLYQTPSQGVPLPSVYAYTSNGVTYDTNLLEINPSSGFSGSVPTSQWSTYIRVDLLPANTTITANYYGFNKSFTFDYQPSKFQPNDTLFGYESFGNLVTKTGYNWPGNFPPAGSSTAVTSSNGVSWAVGPGDYRWYASVLRWGGDENTKSNWDTWLGPVIRFT